MPKYYNAEEKGHREFCQLFGPEKIIGNLGSFLRHFMAHKVMVGEEFKRAAGTVAKKLSMWLMKKEYVSGNLAREGVEEIAEVAQDLPNAERAAQLLRDAVNRLTADPNDFEDEDYMEFDHYAIAKVEAGKLWFEFFEGGGRSALGPIPVPKNATELLQKGWEISCALGRTRGKWHLIEVANVYP